MEVTVEKISTLTRKLKIVLPEEEVSKEIEAAYRKLKTEVKLKGFRRGKVPRQILEKNYGPQVKAEVGEKLVQATYFDAVEKENLDVVAHPDIKTHNFSDKGTFTYEAEVDIRPLFDLKKYKGIEIEKPQTLVSDSELSDELENMRKENAPLKGVEGRAIANNDICIVDFQGFHDGEPLPQVKAVGASIDVGSGRNGKEFEDQLIGMKAGDDSKISIDFSTDNANPILAGKTIDFHVSVKDVKERVLAELDDEFAKDVDGHYNTLGELKNHIREEIQKKKDESFEGDISDKIMHSLIEGHEFDIPARLVQYEIDEYIKQTEQRFKANGLSLEEAGVNKEEMASHYKDAAERRIRGDFIIKKIAEEEKIKLEEEDINKGFQRIADQYNMTVNEVKGYFKSREDMLPFLNELLNEKIIKFLRAEAVIKEISDSDIEKQETEDQATGDEA